MNEDDKKENEVTPEGAVEVDESDLDKAAGGISSYSKPTDQQLKLTPTAPTYDLKSGTSLLGDGSVKPAEYDLKKI